MRLSASDLEELTPYQFNLMREGYRADQVSEWERAKFISYYIYLMAGKMVEKPVTMEEFLPLTEKDVKALKKKDRVFKKRTPEEEAEIFKFFNPDK